MGPIRLTAVRLAVAMVAVLAIAWFVLLAVQARSLTQASAIVDSSARLTPERATSANSLLNTAGTLNPDSRVDQVRAELLLGQGRQAAARAVLVRLTHREPDNILAWDLLAHAGDPLALAQVARLEPNVGAAP